MGQIPDRNSEFPNLKLGSIDLVWRCWRRRDALAATTFAFTEFKRPDSISRDGWGAGVGSKRGKVKGPTLWQNRQTSKYVFSSGATDFILTDFKTAVAVRALVEPAFLMKRKESAGVGSDGALEKHRIVPAEVSVWGGGEPGEKHDGLLMFMLAHLLEALFDKGLIQ